MHRRPLTALFLFTCLLFCSPASAQQETATITGTVTDESGAIVPRATVTVTNVQTNIPSKAETNGDGVLRDSQSAARGLLGERGTPGFRKTLRTGVTLQIAQVAPVDLTLQTGPLDRDDRSRRRRSLLETQTSSRGLVIDQKKIVELPLNGRDYNLLALLSPGVLPATPRLPGVGFQGRAERQRQPHVQQRLPARRRGQHLLLELLPRRERSARAAVDRGAAGIQDPDQRLLGGVRAQLGRGRQRHDQVGDEHRAGEASTNSCATTRWTPTTSSRTRWGRRSRSASATSSARAIGGPLVPNRTFWFADYEGLRDQEGIPRTRLVPTAAEKAGRFSSAVVDPFAAGRPAFSQNDQGQWVIPEDRWDPVGAAIVALIPHPNVPGSAIYASTPVTDTRQDQFDVRIDHQFTNEHHVLRTLQLRRHGDVPSGAAAGPRRGLVQRRIRIERQPVAGARARTYVDDLAEFRRRRLASVTRAATTTRPRRTSESTARRKSG